MTIRDIARESGYAVSTVSRVLNNHPDVSEATKQKIGEIVERMGFVPNANARQLKVQQTAGIIVLVKGAFNMFFAGIVERIQNALAEENCAAVVHYLDEDTDELLFGEQLVRERKPLGIIFLGGNVASFEKRFSRIHIPCVLATTVSDTLQFDNLSCVGVDDTHAGEEACRYLIEKGHTDIAVLGGRRDLSYISVLRYQGFCNAYRALQGVEHDESLYEKCSFNMASGYRAMQRILTQGTKVTAVFCMSDLIAVGAIRAIADAGMRVPDDISVLGFDGVPISRFATPRLATIEQPQKDIADESVRMMLEQLAGNPAQTQLILPVSLIDEESVCAPKL